MVIDSSTNIGVKREDNQDSYWCSRLKIGDDEVGVLCICDGMGGLEDGALASQTVVSMLRDYLLSNNHVLGISSVLHNANAKILAMSKELSIKQGKKVQMGTTCTILVCKNGLYNLFHIGDSRCYKVRDDVAELLTEDHNGSQLLKTKGLNPNEPKYHSYRNKLTRCMGVKEVIELDESSGSYKEGDTFLVCSDGFWHYLDLGFLLDENIIDNLEMSINKCMDAGEKDNITVGVLKI